MKYNQPLIPLILLLLLAISSVCNAQRDRRSNRGGISNIPNHPQEIGESGIAWYTTWDSGLAEAKRSNRPIFFMSAAATCSGVPGVF